MQVTEYQKLAYKTAIYDQKVVHPVLGLCGESAEAIAKIGTSTTEEIIKELGDVCWYVAAIASDLGKDMPNGQPLPTVTGSGESLTRRFVSHVGQVAELTKKQIRDGVDNSDKIVAELRHVMTFIVKFAAQQGFSLEGVLMMNLSKLNSRKERGVLQGSGANR
jgi:NTP pyrophosphatase (non-canonical NTP hydrolase)